MARARLLKPGFFQNEVLAELPPHARLLFAGLWTIADREGRMDDRPKRIKAEVFPYEPKVNVPKLLAMLEEKGFIQRYQIRDAHFIQIVKFDKHQSPHVKEPASTIPAPDKHGASTGNSGTSPAEAEAVTETVAEAEAVAENAPAHPFAFTYAKEYQQRHAGRPPSPVEHGAALALAREYGDDACLQLAADFDWQKHPNYLRPILEERRDGKRNRKDSGEQAAGSDSESVASTVQRLLEEQSRVFSHGSSGA